MMEVDSFLQVREILNSELTFYLQRAQKRMKKLADENRRDKEFKEGDWVLLKIQPYRQESLAKKGHHKLGKRFYGLFQIKKQSRKGCIPLDLA